MNIERRALFNSLRMNWLSDPSIKVQAWQVENYRLLSAEELLSRLRKLEINLDKTSFVALAQNTDSPEDLCDALLADVDLNVEIQDQIYLLIFELWRRYVNEKPCLSIFCDELDYQIFAYDHGGSRPEDIQDAIANLEVILDENTDEGADPVEVFEMISNSCANDLETFLYDYIAEQIDGRNNSYAGDLLDGLGPYFKDNSWFDFLRARLVYHSDPEASDQIIRHVVQDIKEQQDLDLSLEVLSFLANGGDPVLFRHLAKHTVSMLETEEDFQELLTICADYYHCLDQDREERIVQKILKERPSINLDSSFKSKDSHVTELMKVL